jgi:hypothetical protein
MSIVQEARTLIAKAKLSQQLLDYADGGYMWDGQFSFGVQDLDSAALAASLDYQVELHGVRISDESEVPVGASKYKGLPHLPKDMAWPKGLYFAAQINLVDLAQVDRSQRLPKSGMLYFFFNNATDCAVVHWDGPVADLAIRSYPEASELPQSRFYLKEFIQGAERVDLRPYWLVHMNKGDSTDYREIQRLLSPELSASITELLGAPTLPWNPTCRLYGRPLYWQGEDEGLFPVGFDDAGMPIFEEVPPRLLLFQDELGDANIHFWCDPEAAKAGDFSQAELGASGT